MGFRGLSPVALLMAALSLVAGLAFGGSALMAQETGGTPGPIHAGVHPAHIHEGTCDTLGGVVFPLQDVSGMNMMMAGTPTPDTGMTSDAGMGTPPEGAEDVDVTTDVMASPTPDMNGVIAGSTTTVEASLDVILGAEHAINVHESAENIENYIACGDLTGTPSDGQLEVQLQELNDSGYSGRATLRDNGDGTTTVTIELMMASGMTPATPTM